MKFVIILILLSISFTINAQTWTHNGPFGAKITSIANDHSDSTIIYVGTYGKGIYKSTDSGANWFLTNNGLPGWENKTVGSPTLPSWWFGDHYPINTIIAQRDSSNYIYAGLDGGGIVFSSDKGNSWKTLNTGLPDSPVISVIWINPTNPSFLLCGLRTPEHGLFKSMDGGESWSFVSEVQDNDYNIVWDIKHNPFNPDSIYVSIGLTLFLSPDNGVSWAKVTNEEFIFDRLLLRNNEPNHILAIVDTGFEDNVLMHSTDGGQNWDFFPEGEHWGYVSALEEDISGNIYVYKQDENNLLISKDDGTTWISQKPISNFGEFNGDAFMLSSFIVSHHNPQNIFIGTYAGLFHSSNGGIDYVLKETGMINTYINALAVNPKNLDIAYAGGENGLWKTENRGAYWQRLSLMNVNAIAIDEKYPDTLYVGGDSLVRSLNGGESFALLFTGRSITEIELHPNLNNIIFSGVYPSTVKKSEDFGDNWITSFTPDHAAFRIKDIEFHQTNDSIVYFGTDYNQIIHGLYKSTDLGENWAEISDPGLIKSIVLSSNNDDTVYVCTSNNIQVSGNGGNNFSVLFDSISSNMNSILKYPPEKQTMLAATKDKGGFILNLGDNTFKAIAGDYDPRLTSINFHSENDFYFSTHGDGVWLGKEIITSIDNPFKNKTIPLSFDIIGSYPNPFNNSAKIRFKVNVLSEIGVRIYNISGQLIQEYPFKKYLPGTHSIEWNGNTAKKQSVSSGLYIVSISNGVLSRYHKIILLK